MNVIGFGRTAEFIEIDTNHVAKLFNEGIPYEVAKQEYEKHCAINKQFKSMPFAVELKVFEGKNGIIYQRINGILLSQYMSENPLKLNAILDDFSILHESINCISVVELPRGDDFLIHKIKKSPVLRNNEKNLVTSFIEATEKNNLCHGVFHPENVMIDKKNKLCVIDWLTTFSGNSLFDVARTYYLLRYGKSPKNKKIIEYIIEGLFRLIYPRRYLHNRISKSNSRELFLPFLFIVLVLRLDDKISEEEKLIKRKIKELKRKSLKIMVSHLA